jgi:hypothetical protein
MQREGHNNKLTMVRKPLPNLVLESIVLSLCPRLSLVAGLDLFWFSLILSICCHLTKSIYKTDHIYEIDPIYKTDRFHPSCAHRNLDSKSIFQMAITFARNSKQGAFFEITRFFLHSILPTLLGLSF